MSWPRGDSKKKNRRGGNIAR
ncbi:cytoplasmic protein [Gallid alphaherpesvirus 2]|uniref:Cytoplasmic protein n=1 Tax=Gallid alphaherpesvirus 2 TaxID=10390 RepID=A7KQA9_9ALPH|nr:cytoplasmic protein [Gallid alphaherpesvirus 2]ABR13220.1 cytoplasmic protein [Gallid alphaherpesvirus 2]QOT14100.1 cytoplasmic protein [Gallid alphaherpesvirus 2]QOT14123.1 cytoplasmic protein [Gallid alphaherpesvirus 2]QOT14286.1 cytoplasmic protein [Gallid alphaherpesvirus 2]